MLIIIILSIPYVQTTIAKKVTTKLNEEFGTDIYISRLGLNWKGEVDIREVYIADHHQDTLIFAKSLQTNILSIKNLIEGELNFGFIDLNQAKFYLKTYEGEENDNIIIFAEKFNSDKPQKSDAKFELFANNVSFKDSKVKIIDEGFEDSEIFNLNEINIKAKKLLIRGPTVFTDIKKLSLKARRGFVIKDLIADFSYTTTDLKLEKLNFKTEGSSINGDILLSYDEIVGMSDFENSVSISAGFENSQISTNDLNAFYNEFAKSQFIDLTGVLMEHLIILLLQRLRLIVKELN